MTTTAAHEQIIHGVMDGWKSAIAAHRPLDVAEHFTDDAVFQGLRPYTVGRRGVAAYYDSQPLGLTADYRIVETRQVAENAVFGYLDVDFSFTDRPTLHVQLGVLLTLRPEGWLISHYQVSKLD